jgi:hypothetical protein
MKRSSRRSLANWKAISQRANIAQQVCNEFGIRPEDLMRAGPVPVAGNKHARFAAEVPVDPYAERVSSAWLEYVSRIKAVFLITMPKKRTKKQKEEDANLKNE